MPLDGTNYDEATRQLIDAKQLLIEKGWCVGQRENQRGEHCALGALDAVIGGMAVAQPSVVRLAAAIPDRRVRSPLGLAWDVAAFNNAQTSIEPILEWFDLAIAG